MESDNEETNKRVVQSVNLQAFQSFCGKKELKLALNEHDMEGLDLLVEGLIGNKTLTLGNKDSGPFMVSGIVSHPDHMTSDLETHWNTSVTTCEVAGLRFDSKHLYEREKTLGKRYNYNLFVDSYHKNVSGTKDVDRTVSLITVNVHRSNSFLYHKDFKVPITKPSGELVVSQSCLSARAVSLVVRKRNPRALNDSFVFNLVRENLTDSNDISSLCDELSSSHFR